ncbi:polysaccharide deacetylase family protein [Streptococcus sp. 20925_1_22]|uniref:polysaccharide deacetylase family protein n=1 Tax=Streptococcus sp. 20925_1_22 TaxID=3003645 RepID=UPI0028D51D8B|nr:polysaccharide deacetylase family protein [uncultured Streptococcus sp.]
MKRQNNKKHGKKTLIVLSLLGLAFIAALILGAVKIYAIFQEKELQEKVSVLISQEETFHAEKTEKQSKMIGSHYVEAFYPLLDGQVMASVKEQMDADSQTIKDNQKKGDKIEELTFYYAEEKETSLKDVKEVLVHRKDYHVKEMKISKGEEREVADSYLGADGSRFTLDKLFQDPDAAKEIFINEISSQLTFRQADESVQTEILNTLNGTELGQWSFRYEYSHFSIKLSKEVQGLTSIDVPLSSFYDQINADYLTGDDLAAYQSFEAKKHVKMVALTFDDGPDPKTTPQALDILKKYGAKATFFMVGQNIAGNEAIVKRVHNEDHQIGIHTWDHPVLTKLPLESAQKEILDTQTAINNVIGIKPTITRPPYGAINATIQNSVDQSFIMWNVDSLDWKTRNTKAIMQEIAKTQPGSIILMHDIHQTSIDALPSVLEYLKSNGYTLVTVDELLEGQLEPHRIYYGRD